MKYILIIAVISLNFLNQISYSQPTATVQFVGGYSIPLGDYKGIFSDTRVKFTGNGNTISNSYYMKSGINYGIFVKVPVKKYSPFSIKGGVAFNVFSQSKEYAEDSTSVTIDLKQSLFGITIGADYDFGGRKSKIKPFIGAELSGNFFAGSYKEDYVDSTETYNLNAAFRLGVNLTAGVDVMLHHNIGVLVGAKYSFANFIGKNYEANTRTKYNLNDKNYTVGSVSYPSRNITFLQLFGGLSFYFGR